MPRIGTVPFVAFGAVLALSALVRADGRQAQSSSPWTPELERVMTHHYRDVSAIHEAVIRGDLNDVRDRARNLAAMTDPPSTPPVTSHVMTIRRAAARAVMANTLDVAADATATMLAQCGGCHESRAVRPSPAERRAPDVGGIVGHMVDHQRAVDALLQGLVIPSMSEWQRGAGLLRAPVLRDAELPPDPRLAARATATERTLHALAEVAAAAPSREARVSAYARIIGTCATCHSLHPEIWGPGQGIRATGRAPR
jgi:mono/diheme cytochrome c family protein